MIKKSKQETEVIEITEADRARWARMAKWEWTEASIWTDAMLVALDNGVKGGKWFSLIDKACRLRTLEAAWEKVRANKGASGVDKITIEIFEARKGKYLNELEQELSTGTYQPQAVKRVYIPKGQGKLRPLGIPTVKDRIAQQAVKMTIEPIFEKEFIDMSYGFRPKKGAQMAIAEVSNLITEGYTWVVDADLQAYFDTIPHENLIMKVKQRISDNGIIRLIDMWLKQEIMEECNGWVPTQGTPQGGVISPLLSNVYIHDLDVLMKSTGYKMVRYADDFVILTKSQVEAEEALKLLQAWVIENGLTLHPDKTHLGRSSACWGMESTMRPLWPALILVFPLSQLPTCRFRCRMSC